MLFITVRSASPADVPKVLQVVEHVKRLRHKRGNVHPIRPSPLSVPTFLSCEPAHPYLFISAEVTTGNLSEELHQYVIYDAQTSVGLHRIKLDDPPNAYTPPSSLTVHLSKIPMPELRPHPHGARPPPPPPKPPRSISSSWMPRQPPQPPSPQAQMRASSAPLEVSVPTIPTQQQHLQPHTGIGSLLWGRARKLQH
jgi:hypothetical protein